MLRILTHSCDILKPSRRVIDLLAAVGLRKIGAHAVFSLNTSVYVVNSMHPTGVLSGVITIMCNTIKHLTVWRCSVQSPLKTERGRTWSQRPWRAGKRGPHRAAWCIRGPVYSICQYLQISSIIRHGLIPACCWRCFKPSCIVFDNHYFDIRHHVITTHNSKLIIVY
jgi:hypothetical protein